MQWNMNALKRNINCVFFSFHHIHILMCVCVLQKVFPTLVCTQSLADVSVNPCSNGLTCLCLAGSKAALYCITNPAALWRRWANIVVWQRGVRMGMWRWDKKGAGMRMVLRQKHGCVEAFKAKEPDCVTVTFNFVQTEELYDLIR